MKKVIVASVAVLVATLFLTMGEAKKKIVESPCVKECNKKYSECINETKKIKSLKVRKAKRNDCLKELRICKKECSKPKKKEAPVED